MQELFWPYRTVVEMVVERHGRGDKESLVEAIINELPDHGALPEPAAVLDVLRRLEAQAPAAPGPDSHPAPTPDWQVGDIGSGVSCCNDCYADLVIGVERDQSGQVVALRTIRFWTDDTYLGGASFEERVEGDDLSALHRYTPAEADRHRLWLVSFIEQCWSMQDPEGDWYENQALDILRGGRPAPGIDWNAAAPPLPDTPHALLLLALVKQYRLPNQAEVAARLDAYLQVWRGAQPDSEPHAWDVWALLYPLLPEAQSGLAPGDLLVPLLWDLNDPIRQILDEPDADENEEPEEVIPFAGFADADGTEIRSPYLEREEHRPWHADMNHTRSWKMTQLRVWKQGDAALRWQAERRAEIAERLRQRHLARMMERSFVRAALADAQRVTGAPFPTRS